MERCENCLCPSCSERCEDYLLLLQELLEAEALIEQLRFEIDCLSQNEARDD